MAPPVLSSFVREAKARALSLMKGTGTYALLRDSRWRARRLLILCYHGISLDDEHEWDPMLYMSPAQFQARLDILVRHGYAVLPLPEALDALQRGTLPPRSVTLTFDDGTHDFYARAFPALDARRMPATVYLTTYYCDRGRPVFNLMCSYLLWKGRGRSLVARELVGGDTAFDLRDPQARRAACLAILARADREHLSSADKQAVVERLAEILHVDYGALAERRALHIMAPREVGELAARGVDFQLHTHRHRAPLDRDLFRAEIDDNRVYIERLTGRRPLHFCYPSGWYRPEFHPWLTEEEVRSATTCDPGLATPDSRMLQLPRFVDTSVVSPVVFEGWLTGAAAWLPRKRSYAHG